METALLGRQVLRLPPRQTEGFMCSLVRALALPLSILDFSSLSRRGIGLTDGSRAHIFVAALGASSYTYACATQRETMPSLAQKRRQLF